VRTVDIDAYEAGVLAADRTMLGRAITLVESTRRDHQDAAQQLLARLLPKTGGAHRIGITGVPGAGKSTFIDAVGSDLTASGNRVAVLAVDPSSSRTGGSILGDKTRMGRLAVDDHAFIRPSPSSGVLGGVARATRETIVVVEAAGFDVVFVETVGVGQSEITVANMVDTFLLLTLARAGDSLQGIKKGVLELADVIAVNKADGEYVQVAKAAAQELTAALHLMAGREDGWVTPVLTCSATEQIDLDTVWDQLCAHRRHLERTGQLAEQRRRQDVRWMWSTIDDRLLARFRAANRDRARRLEEQVRRGEITPTRAAELLLDHPSVEGQRSVEGAISRPSTLG
jgi:LAO/AO transport system kinase